MVAALLSPGVANRNYYPINPGCFIWERLMQCEDKREQTP